MKIRIFKGSDEKFLEDTVNQWLNINTQYKIIHMNLSFGKSELYMVISYVESEDEKSLYKDHSPYDSSSYTLSDSQDYNHDISEAEKLSRILEGKTPAKITPPPKSIIAEKTEVKPGNLIKRSYGKW